MHNEKAVAESLLFLAIQNNSVFSAKSLFVNDWSICVCNWGHTLITFDFTSQYLFCLIPQSASVVMWLHKTTLDKAKLKRGRRNKEHTATRGLLPCTSIFVENVIYCVLLLLVCHKCVMSCTHKVIIEFAQSLLRLFINELSIKY